MQIKLEVRGLTETLTAMSRRTKAFRGMTQTALFNTLTDVQRDIWTGFDESRQVGGQAWAPLNPGYAAWKRKQGYSPKPNIKTGALRAYWSMTVSGNRGVLRSTAVSKQGDPYGARVHKRRPITPTDAAIRARAVANFTRLAREAAR